MKRIARTLVIVTLASAATAAVAADSPFPASVENQVPLSEVFPNIVTYEQQHHDSAVNQPAMDYPAKGQTVIPLSQEFPNIVTYKQEHKNDPVAQSNNPAYPAEALQEYPLSGEFPNIVTYKQEHTNDPNQASDGAVGATR